MYEIYAYGNNDSLYGIFNAIAAIMGANSYLQAIAMVAFCGFVTAALAYAFNDDGSFRINEFHGILFKKFKEGSGYYGWSGLRYLLFEYEQTLLDASRQRKVSWGDLLKPGSDKVSVEHVYPQTPTVEWEQAFMAVLATVPTPNNLSQ